MSLQKFTFTAKDKEVSVISFSDNSSYSVRHSIFYKIHSPYHVKHAEAFVVSGFSNYKIIKEVFRSL